VKRFNLQTSKRPRARRPRGLSLLELLLALMITVMVAAAIAGMLGAVSSGVGARRDSRALMVLGDAAEARLSAYIAPSRCLLNADNAHVVLWFNDSRESQTIHATEVRWFAYNAGANTIDVSYVRFPSEWSQAAKDLEDKELPVTSDWNAVLANYQANGWTSTQSLIDTIQSLIIRTDAPAAVDSRHITFEIEFESEIGPATVTVAGTIRQHEAPAS